MNVPYIISLELVPFSWESCSLSNIFPFPTSIPQILGKHASLCVYEFAFYFPHISGITQHLSNLLHFMPSTSNHGVTDGSTSFFLMVELCSAAHMYTAFFFFV